MARWRPGGALLDHSNRRIGGHAVGYQLLADSLQARKPHVKNQGLFFRPVFVFRPGKKNISAIGQLILDLEDPRRSRPGCYFLPANVFQPGEKRMYVRVYI